MGKFISIKLSTNQPTNQPTNENWKTFIYARTVCQLQRINGAK